MSDGKKHKRNRKGELEITNADDFMALLEQATALEKLSNINITKVKVKDRQVTVTYDELDCNGSGQVVTIIGYALAHNDLLNAFRCLNLHLAYICDLKEAMLVQMDEENYLAEELNHILVTASPMEVMVMVKALY